MSWGDLADAELRSETRKNGGWVSGDPFCLGCGDYRSNHAIPVGGAHRKPLCLWAPTVFEPMTHDQWVTLMVAQIEAKMQQEKK